MTNGPTYTDASEVHGVERTPEAPRNPYSTGYGDMVPTRYRIQYRTQNAVPDSGTDTAVRSWRERKGARTWDGSSTWWSRNGRKSAWPSSPNSGPRRPRHGRPSSRRTHHDDQNQA